MKLRLPKSWHDISIGQFQQLQRLTDATFENQIITLSIVTGKTIDEIEELTPLQITEAIAKMAFMSELPKPSNADKFKIGFMRYRFAVHQNQIAAHQFITAQDLFSDRDKWVDNLHKIMAALCVGYDLLGRKHLLNANDFEKTANRFKSEMPIAYAFGYTLFFSSYSPVLHEITQAYLDGVRTAAKMHGFVTE
jgi:hypothetical protein